jgi:pimeloyl-ACP methyl ester carboxylesterase
VPEHASKPTGSTIALEVMVLPARQPPPTSEPIIFVDGGPGVSGIASVAAYQDLAVRNKHDLVVFDQRGTGSSKPNLSCPESRKAQLGSFNTADQPAKEMARIAKKVATCFDRFRANGIDTAAYNTIEAANDVASIAKALKAPRVHLYGVSYGTRVVLETIRSHSTMVTAATVDSVSPPSATGVAPAEFLKDGQAGFEHLFKQCAAQPSCSADHGDLSKKLARLTTKFNQKPVTVSYQTAAGTQQARLTGNDFAAISWNLLGNNDAVALVPATIDAFLAGDTTIISNALSGLSAQMNNVAHGAQIAIECNDSAYRPTAADRQVLRAGGWPTGVLYFYAAPYCAAAKSTPVPDSFRTAVTSQVPTLVLAGAFDPNTGAEGSKRVANALPNSVYVEIADRSHVVLNRSECAQTIFAAFIEAPSRSVDISCAATVAPPTFK